MTIPEAPPLHVEGLVPPAIPKELVPQHVAMVMDGNGRWANQRGLPRTKGHEAGEAQLIDVIAGCIEMGIPNLSAYMFSTENWRRSPDEVRALMRELTAAAHRAIGAPIANIRVCVREVPTTHWSAGDVTVAERQAAITES